jgi:hypothetical protein
MNEDSKIKSKVRNFVWDSVAYPVVDSVGAQVRSSVWDSILSSMLDSLREPVEDKLKDYEF